jgi:hypothetical protein
VPSRKRGTGSAGGRTRAAGSRNTRSTTSAPTAIHRRGPRRAAGCRGCAARRSTDTGSGCGNRGDRIGGKRMRHHGQVVGNLRSLPLSTRRWFTSD